MSAYGLWWRDLPADVEVVGVQLPGRESRVGEPPLTSITAMADAALAAIRHASDLPYAIFGHSMGALVAFELAFRIEADDTLRMPSHLFLSARSAPGSIEPVLNMRELPDDELLDALEFRFGAVTDEVRGQPELLELLVPLLRADVTAVETYRPAAGRIVKCPVDVCGGSEDKHPRPEELAAWQAHVELPLGIRVFGGDHFFLSAERASLLRWIAAVWR